MSEFFLKIVNMSISASWLVLAVLLLRLVLKKAPKWASVLLWGIVAVRLICPFSIESMLSLIPSAETISPEIMMDRTPEISTGIASLNSVINPILTASFAPDPSTSANPLQILIPVAAVIWIAGVAVMLIYTAVSYWLLRRKVATAVLLRDNIFQSENVDSPFVLGIIKPRIYLPFRMDEQNLEYVVAHEGSHIRRKDHWWKPFGFLLLAIHWFNPLVWLSYILLCRDIELACDEKVIREMDNESKADYTQALVACSVNRRSIAACPLAFGEVGVKERVKSVMNYKKPAFWIIVAAVIICIVVAVCFLTNPKDTSAGALPNIYAHTYVVEEVTYEGGMYSFTVVAGENSPIYAITEDMTLASQMEVSEEGVWAELGKLEEMTLTKENFDDLFKTPGNWADSANAKNVRNNTENAWQLIYNQKVFYYILQQKNGDLYLAYGYQEPDKDADPGSFKEHIRWIFKLAVDVTGETGMIAKSGGNVVPMVSFPKGTVIGEYVDSVYWLTINPSYKELVPFSVWQDGKEIRGFYNAFDAETFEPIEYFVPSGLDPQTYLFQNADPTRAYIVLATFSKEEGSEIYAFGARFDSTVSPVGGVDAPQNGSVSDAPINGNAADENDNLLDKPESRLEAAISAAIFHHNQSEKPDGLLNTESHIILANEVASGTPVVGQTEHIQEETVFLLYLNLKFSVQDGKLEEHSGHLQPAAITFTVTEAGEYILKDYWEPRDGSYYAEDIREKFPGASAEDALNDQKYVEDLTETCWKTASDYLSNKSAGASAQPGGN